MATAPPATRLSVFESGAQQGLVEAGEQIPAEQCDVPRYGQPVGSAAAQRRSAQVDPVEVDPIRDGLHRVEELAQRRRGIGHLRNTVLQGSFEHFPGFGRGVGVHPGDQVVHRCIADCQQFAVAAELLSTQGGQPQQSRDRFDARGCRSRSGGVPAGDGRWSGFGRDGHGAGLPCWMTTYVVKK